PLFACVLRLRPDSLCRMAGRQSVPGFGGGRIRNRCVNMGTWGEHMSQLFSTELLAPSDRIDAWQWNAQRICGDCRIRLPKSSFHGSIEIRHVGGLPLTRFSSSPLSFWKDPLDAVTAENRSCIVITQIA